MSFLSRIALREFCCRCFAGAGRNWKDSSMPARPLRRIAHLARPCLRPGRACARRHISHAKMPVAPSCLTNVTSFHSVVGNKRRGDAHERRDGHRVQPPTRTVIVRGDVRIEYWCKNLAQGNGPIIVLLPSLGRGASDFDPIAERLARAGYRVLRPQPRGIGQSVGPLTGIDLHDMRPTSPPSSRTRTGARLSWSGTRSAIASPVCSPPIVRIWCVPLRSLPPISARLRARPRYAQRSAPAPTPRCRTKSGSRRCNRLLCPRQRSARWLAGWHPEVLAAQRIAGDRTSREEDFAAGRAPILYVQPDHDPLAHADDVQAYKAQFGDRVTIVTIARASHAVIVEQPEAVSAALIAYARQLWAAE